MIRFIRCLAATLLLIVLPYVSTATGEAPERRIALTFDDLPYMEPMGYWEPREISNLILRALEKFEAPAAGFVVEERVDQRPGSLIALSDWAERGHLLGNQTFANVDLHQLRPADFLHHVRDGQRYLQRLARIHRFDHRYFRFPFLHQGETSGKRREVLSGLHGLGYRVAPVTVKVDDAVLNRVFVQEASDLRTQERLKEIYLEHLLAALEYSEKRSRELFEREITQILRLHACLASAMYLADVLELLHDRGYRFVSLEEALEDPAYQTEDDYAGPEGLTFLDRIAAQRRLPLDPEKSELSEAEIRRRLSTP